jgi:hypothetical protein
VATALNAGGSLWAHRRAAPVRLRDRLVVTALAAGGAVALVLLLDWWFRGGHLAHAGLFVALSLVFWYGMSRIVLGWVNYLAIGAPPHRPAPAGLHVAIFTTSAPGEPLDMFETTLRACARITYPHTTYLLDDTRDPRFGEAARATAPCWLELLDVPGAKAGKINRALAMTDRGVHPRSRSRPHPVPDFLDRVLGHFDDERVGFVQVAQAYYNQDRSFTAAGAAEQTYAFYGPVQMGLHGHGAAVAIGANCTFRRAALDSIGGHGIGLAEDLVTAIRLHAAGWRSVYVPEIVSRGLVPEDLGSFYRQQLKWARGVYEVRSSRSCRRAFRRLTWRQRLSYLPSAPTTSAAHDRRLPAATVPLPLDGRAAGEHAVCRVPDRRRAGRRHRRRHVPLRPALARRSAARAGAPLARADAEDRLLAGLPRRHRARDPALRSPVHADREAGGRRGASSQLAWPHLLVLAAYTATRRPRGPRPGCSARKTRWRSAPRPSGACWRSRPCRSLASAGALYAAWQSRTPLATGPWERLEDEGEG